MDKTLKEYIDRTIQKLNEEKLIPLTPNPNHYSVYPEQKQDEDRPNNPFGQH